MKNFSRRQYRIAEAPTATKLVYSFFLIFALVGWVTIAAFQCEVIGWGLETIRNHYLGNEAQMSFPKSFLQLLETTHAHAFIMGLLYLTLAHIVLGTRLAERMKLFLIILGFVATGLDLALPWLIRYAGAPWAALLPVAWVGEWIAYGSYILIPAYDMWLKKAEVT